MKRDNSGKTKRTVDPKAEALRQQGTLHPNPEVVRDELFQRDEFFDPRDLVQVRYEMLRRHKVDGKAITEVADNFGISRQAYYMTGAAFEKEGIAGLLPRPRGPQRAHKCSDEVLDFVQQWHADASAPETVGGAVQKRFGVSIHPRSLARALARRKKKTAIVRIGRQSAWSSRSIGSRSTSVCARKRSIRAPVAATDWRCFSHAA